MKRDLNSFFDAKSIAIIGASNTEGKVGNVLMQKVRYSKSRIIPINPHEEKILGKKAYKKIQDYPHKIELAIIAIPSKFVLKILEDCAKKGIKNIIIISSGFSEVGNFNLETKIAKLIKKYNLNILGPNCFGMINPKKNIDLTFSKESARKGNVAFISQSGALLSYILDYGIKLSGFISLGNMIDLNFADWIEYFNKDRRTKKIVCYIEKLKDGRRFIDACKSSKKEIVVVKAGKTSEGKKATMSHTASLATDALVYSGAFKQAKVKEESSLIEAFGIKSEKIDYKIKGKNICIITNAGGAGALLADKLSEKGYNIIGIKDILGTAKAIDYKRALQRIKGEYDSILVVLTPQNMSEPFRTAEIISNSIHKDKIVACFLGKKSVEEAISLLRKEFVACITKGV